MLRVVFFIFIHVRFIPFVLHFFVSFCFSETYDKNSFVQSSKCIKLSTMPSGERERERERERPASWQ